MKVAFVKKMANLCLVACLLTAAVAQEDAARPLFRGRFMEQKKEARRVDASRAIIEGHVWLDRNRNGIQDTDEHGVEDVLVELCTPTSHSVDHATETGGSGEFQFVIDALDLVDPLGSEEFYIQVYSPDGYNFLLPLSFDNSKVHADDTSTVNDAAVAASTPFQVVLGETYKMNVGLITACDPALGFISFSGIKSASSSNDGRIAIEWNPALLLPYDENISLDCDDNDIRYHVFVAPAPFDYSPYSLPDLIELSKGPDNVVHVETDELHVVIDDMEPDDTVSLLVKASAFGIVSEVQEQLDVAVQYHPELESNGKEILNEMEDSVAASKGEAPVQRREQEKGWPLINEVLWLPNPASPSFSERRMFLEMYLADGVSLGGCWLEKNDGSLLLDFDEAVGNIYGGYWTIKHKSSLKKPVVIQKRKRIIWMRDFFLNEVDSVGLFCNDKMVDFVAWGKDGERPKGKLIDDAVKAGMWSGYEDFVETGSVDLVVGSISKRIQPGMSLARDKDSTDTNGPKDWTYPGGLNARIPTPSSRNFQDTYTPVINEILFWPRPRSRFFRKRRAFIEIYRRDTTFSLFGCSLVNHDGSVRIDFGDSFDSVDHHYITVEGKKTLNDDFKLSRKRGILWMRDLVLEKTDAVALICDGIIVDYVAWGEDGHYLDAELRSAAVRSGVWHSTEDYVEVKDLKKGQSLGRDALSRNTHNKMDWSFPGGSDADGATPSTRNEPSEPDDTLLQAAVDNFNSFFNPNLVIESTEVNGTVYDVPATSMEMMDSLALVTATSFEDKASLMTRDDLPDSVTEEDLEQMRAELASFVAEGDIRILVTLYDKRRDRRVACLNTMSVGGRSFSGTLMAYTHLPGSFFDAPGSEHHRLLEIVEVTESERHIITRHLWGAPGFIIDTDIDCRGAKYRYGFPLGCFIDQRSIQGRPAVFGEIYVLPFARKAGEPPSYCLGKSEYAWATGFKSLKVLPSKDSVEVEGYVGQSSKDALAIDHWCPFNTPCLPQDAQGVGPCARFFGYKWDGEQCVGVNGCSCEGSDCDSLLDSLSDCQDSFLSCSCQEQEQDARGIGECKAILGVRWDGEQCVTLSGCSCEGSDCDSLFQSTEACQEAFLTCICQEQDAQGVGPCDQFFGYKWDGEQCVGVSGCSCEGSDCTGLFDSPTECQEAFLSCSCQEQDAKGVGLCEAILGVRWDGEKCVALSGCSCEGSDCDSLFGSPEDCQEAFLLCSSEQTADEHKQTPRVGE